MNHALECDSSKRPAEECDVERLPIRHAQIDRGADAKANVADACVRRDPFGLSHACWIGLDRQDAGRDRRDLPSQPSVSAADLEDAFALEVEVALNEPKLHTWRRIVGNRLSSPAHWQMILGLSVVYEWCQTASTPGKRETLRLRR